MLSDNVDVCMNKRPNYDYLHVAESLTGMLHRIDCRRINEIPMINTVITEKSLSLCTCVFLSFNNLLTSLTVYK